MPFLRRCPIKKTLKENILIFANHKKYFSIDELKNHFKRLKIPYTDESVKKYLYLFRKENQIYDAGRGWYSTLNNEFLLDKEPVESILHTIADEFPLLSFAVWSTAQIKNYFHHMPASFVTFIYSGYDDLPVLYQSLINQYNNIYLNPREFEIKKSFVIQESTFVLRPSITEEPAQEHLAFIEKILVDLYLEMKRIKLISGAEYDRIFKNILSDSRINIARLLRYAKRREVRDHIKEKYPLTADL